MLSRPERAVLDIALQKYRAGRSERVMVGGINLLRPALRLMTDYRLVIQEVEGPEVITSYTRWIESVQLKEGENQEVYVTFSPRFERIWIASKKRLPDYMEQKPGNAALRTARVGRRELRACIHSAAGLSVCAGRSAGSRELSTKYFL
jgi:hypothetical protein